MKIELNLYTGTVVEIANALPQVLQKRHQQLLEPG